MFQIFVPFVNMKESSLSGSRVVSQALFGESIRVIEARGEWSLIETPDAYRGWVLGECFVESELYPDIQTSRLFAHVYGKPDVEFGPLFTLAYGSPLKVIDEVDARWLKVLLPKGGEAFIQKGDVEEEAFDLFALSQKFLGIPYTWGGRSSFGFDCSGFVQMLYTKMGVSLPRDAKDQILCGEKVGAPCPGDLIFWGKSEAQIQHVGMFLKGDEFIHTSSRENKPYLRISRLSDPEWNGGEGYPFRAYFAMTQKKRKAAATFAPRTMKIR